MIAKIKTTFLLGIQQQQEQILRENHQWGHHTWHLYQSRSHMCRLHSWLQNIGRHHQRGTTCNICTNHGHAWYAVHSQLRGTCATTEAAAHYPASQGCPGLARGFPPSPQDTSGSGLAGLHCGKSPCLHNIITVERSWRNVREGKDSSEWEQGRKY